MKPVLETYMNKHDGSIQINVTRNSVGWLGHPGLRLWFCGGSFWVPLWSFLLPTGWIICRSAERLWLFKNGSGPYSELISCQIKGFHNGADEKFFWNKTLCRFVSSYGLAAAAWSLCLQGGPRRMVFNNWLLNTGNHIQVCTFYNIWYSVLLPLARSDWQVLGFLATRKPSPFNQN
jgi:hypothetical protein